ncbi:hypothetical protein D3C73_1519080 [compost metagenome]
MRPYLDRILGKFKLIVAADDENLKLRLKRFGFGGELNAVDAWHSNIGNQHINPVLMEQRQSRFAGLCGNRNRVA